MSSGNDRMAPIEAKRASIMDAARPEAVEKQHRRGKLTARERIDAFLDPGSFREIGGLVEPLRDTELTSKLDAPADGVVTDDELTYLQTVSEAFGFTDATFRRIKASHMGPDRDDPYHILGVAHDAEFEEIRRVYRRLMADNHPDRVIQNGAPREFEQAAHEKAATITSAYARIRAERGLIAVN